MNKKILDFLVFMLLVTTTIAPVVSEKNENNNVSINIESMVTDQCEIILNDNNQQSSSTNNVYHIYEGMFWKLHVTAYWDPPQGKTICLWVDESTLPVGAVFPECNCNIDQVSSTLEWTPYQGQAGTYELVFYIGESCYEAIGEHIVTVVVHPYDPEPQNTYEIYECQDFHLSVTARWMPPEPSRLICLWADESTLPPGATFSSCQCDYGEVTGDFYWHPQIGQSGEYIITFFCGDKCGFYDCLFSIRIIVLQVGEEQIPGLSIYQVDYDFDDGTSIKDSYIGQVKIHQQALLDYYNLTTGFLNIVTPIGWVVQNILITSENLGTNIPYITTKFHLREGVHSSIDVSSIQAFVSFTSTPTPEIDVGEYLTIPVNDITTYAFGEYYIPALPPVIEFPCYPTEWCLQDLDDHPNVQAACNQCAPCAVANSLQFLENTNPGDITIPHDNDPGEDGDNTLPGQLDESMGRGVTSRSQGSGVWPLDGKMKYIDEHNLQQCIKTKYQGHVDPSADNDNHTAGGATAINKGDKVSFDWIYNELCDDEDVEAIIEYPNGGLHAVELTGAGYICGKPFILHISDQNQTDVDPNDEEGCDIEQFEWVSDDGNGNVEVRSGDSGANTKFVQIYSQSLHEPPSNPTGAYDKASNTLKVKSTDPDGDKVRYGIDWDGDGELDEWTDYVDSDEEVEIDCGNHSSAARVIAEDEFGAKSDWIQVNSKSNSINDSLLSLIARLLNTYPQLKNLFLFILG